MGALYVRSRGPRVRLVAQTDGGGHERGIRSGTLNVPGIVGLSKACELLNLEARSETERIRALRDRLFTLLSCSIQGVVLNGDAEKRLTGNLNISIEGIPSDLLIGALPEIAISSGSACTSASLEPSYVLRAMGASDEHARSSLRFGIGRFTTEGQIDRAAELVAAKVHELRNGAPRSLEAPMTLKERA